MNFFLFGIYPYVAISIFVIGCIMRYNSSQREWGAKSSQFLENNHFWMKSTVFHISLILLVLVHIIGLCTPPVIYEFFPDPDHPKPSVEFEADYAVALKSGRVCR